MSFSPDGRYLIAATEQTLLVLGAESGEERARFESTTYLTGASLGPGPTASVAALSRLLHLKFEAFEFGAAIATVAARDPVDTDRTPDDLSVRCGWCGALLPASPNLVDEVRAVGRRWAPGIDRPAAFDLPAEAWSEPGLVISCPACKGSLRLNPFVPITSGRDS